MAITRVKSQDIYDGAIQFNDLLAATNPCLEGDANNAIHVQVDGMDSAGTVIPGGTIVRSASGIKVNVVPTTSLSGDTSFGWLLVGRGLSNGTCAVLAAGTDGQVLAVDATATNHLRWVDPVLGFKNRIINGNFDVWQRNVTFSLSGTTAAYTADRWRGFAGTSGASTIARAAFTLGQTSVPGEPAYYLDWSQTTLTADLAFVEQRIEDVRTLAGQTVTVSFYAQAVTTNFSLTVTLIQSFGTGGSPSADVSTAVGTAALVTTGWTKFTYTVTLPSITGKTIGTNLDSSLKLSFFMPASVVRHAQIAQVQVEASTVKTAFDKRPIGLEVAMCQRYYFKTFDYAVVPGTASAGGLIQGVSSGTLTCIQANFPVLMRASPTVTIYAFSGATAKITQNGGTEIGAFADTFSARGGTISNSVNTVDVTKYFCNITAEAEL